LVFRILEAPPRAPLVGCQCKSEEGIPCPIWIDPYVQNSRTVVFHFFFLLQVGQKSDRDGIILNGTKINKSENTTEGHLFLLTVFIFLLFFIKLKMSLQ